MTEASIRLNDAILALEDAEGRIDEVENPEKINEALVALGAVPVGKLNALVDDYRKKGDRYAANELQQIIEIYE